MSVKRISLIAMRTLKRCRYDDKKNFFLLLARVICVAQAGQTRRRILVSEKSLFQAEGFEGVTIEQMAQEAEVSAPTIYALFQSKRGVLRALMDEALPVDQFEALVKEAMQEKSP